MLFKISFVNIPSLLYRIFAIFLFTFISRSSWCWTFCVFYFYFLCSSLGNGGVLYRIKAKLGWVYLEFFICLLSSLLLFLLFPSSSLSELYCKYPDLPYPPFYPALYPLRAIIQLGNRLAVHFLRNLDPRPAFSFLPSKMVPVLPAFTLPIHYHYYHT